MSAYPQNPELQAMTDHLQKVARDELSWRHRALTRGLGHMRDLLQAQTDAWQHQATELNRRARFATLYQAAAAESVVENLREQTLQPQAKT